MEILITGATSGIGTALATGLLQDGHRLHLHGRDESRLKTLADTLRGQRSRVLTYVADLADSDAIGGMAREVERNTSVLDLVISNAFGKLEKPLSECQLDEISSFVQVSVAGTAQVIRALLEVLKKSSSPRIINVVADWGFPMHNIMTGPAPYISAKYAIHGLGAALQTELGAFGVRTTNICPGVVAADAAYDLDDDDFSEKYGVSAIHPRTLVDAVRFVLSARHSHVRSIVLSPSNPEYNGL